MGNKENTPLSKIINRLNSGKSSGFKSLVFDVIDNPDGTERWLYLRQSKKPRFLAFYNAASNKSRLYHSAVKVLFNLRLGFLVRSRSVCESVSMHGLLGSVVSRYGSNFSIFTGTAGKNRKILIEYGDECGTTGFIKVAFGENSRALIDNEKNILTQLNTEAFSDVVIPVILDKGDGYLNMANIKPDSDVKSSASLSYQHIMAASEYQRSIFKTLHWKDFEKATFSDRLFILKGLGSSKTIEAKIIAEYIELFSTLQCSVREDAVLHCGLSHGDFTSWNLYLSKEKLYLYDWELSRKNIPVLFDFFHYIYQQSVLIERDSLEQIKRKIGVLKGVINRVYPEISNEEFKKQYCYYLLDVSSYYISIYAQQDSLHVQAYWLVDMWIEALKDALLDVSTHDIRF